jgi:hypothetical protein
MLVEHGVKAVHAKTSRTPKSFLLGGDSLRKGNRNLNPPAAE